MLRRNYIVKVWGSTILAAPLMMILATAFIMARQADKLDTGAFGFIAFAVGYGLFLSIPTFLIIYFLFPSFHKRFERPNQLKLALILTGIACIWLTFYLLYGSDAYNLNGNYAALTFSVSYTICLTLFGFIFSIETQTQSC